MVQLIASLALLGFCALAVYSGYQDDYDMVLLGTLGMILATITLYGEKIIDKIGKQ